MELTEAKKLAEERRKEKAEDHLARQRVKDQIARDRAEREACTRPPQVVQTQPKAVAATEVKTYDTCRLQVEMHFPCDYNINRVLLLFCRFG